MCLGDPEIGQPRAADRWLLLPRCWVRLRREPRERLCHPDEALVLTLVDGMLWADRYVQVFEPADLSNVDVAFRTSGLMKCNQMTRSRNAKIQE